MRIITWDGSLALGIESIDTQHEELFRVINSLYDKIQRGTDVNALVEGLDSLRSYVKYHFRTEESLMRDHGYPDLEAHRDEHTLFAGRIEEFAQRPMGDIEATLEELQIFLMQWLVKHIQRTDRKFMLFFNQLEAT